MLTPATRQQYHTLLDALTLNAASANQPAIIFVQTGKAPRVVSRADFCQAVAGCAAALQQLAIAQGDLVAIADTQSPETVFAFWAALMLGALPSMLAPLTEKLDPQIYVDHLAQLTRISGVKLILTASDLASQLTEVVSCPVRDLTSLFEPVQPEIRAMFEPDENAVAFLQHSSGTTGLQKGIALSHRAVLNQIASYSDARRARRRGCHRKLAAAVS